METSTYIIYNGSFKPAGAAHVSVRSRGLMYGDGCFDTFRSYSGRVLALDKHLSRLKEGMQFLDMRYPDLLKPEPVRELLHRLLHKNKLLEKDAVLRIQVWREGGRGYQTEAGSPANFAIVASEYKAVKPEDPVSLATVNIKRIPDQSLPSRYKLSNGINYITAARQARMKGADDALMLTVNDAVSETTVANLFWVKGRTIYTPSKACDLLPGITRELLLEILGNSSSYNAEEGAYPLSDVLNAEAVWICNSVRELVPVKSIDHRSYPVSHPVFTDIEKEFTAYLNRNLSPLL